MKCIPIGLAGHDVIQWLQGGWFLFRADVAMGLEPARISTRDEEYCVEDMDGQTHPMTSAHMFPFWPACGAINLDGFAAYVERRQVRQYRRTYNESCVTVSVPRKWDVMKKHGTEAPNLCANSPLLVKALFSPQYFTYTQALDMMETGRAVSVALNPHLVVAGHLVYYRNKLVARVEGQRIVPIGCEDSRINRIIKFFEGRITL